MDTSQFGGTEISIILGVFIAIICVFIVPYIIYLTTLQATFKEVTPENRMMPPGQVWLLLIPVFGTIWNFVVIARMSESLAKEFNSRGITPDDPKPGYTIGLVMSILVIGSVVPILGSLSSVGAIVCWIIYWVKIAGYKNQLKALNDILST